MRLDTSHSNVDLFNTSQVHFKIKAYVNLKAVLVYSEATVCFCNLSLMRLTHNLFFLKVLVLGNKRDLPNALDEKQLIEKM